MILPYDVTALLRARLAADRRPPDGKLHCSSDLTGSLRHVQLAAAGAPILESDLVSDVRMAIGTDTHTRFERVFRGLPVMLEIKLDPWLPEGWSGTADWLLWDADRRAFVLGDLKTVKPEGMTFIERDGAKESHVWQISAYWHALSDAGFPLVNGWAIYYLPTNQLVAREGVVQPSMQEGTPLPRAQVYERMGYRQAAVDMYLASLNDDGFLTDKLAPVQDRVQKLSLNTRAKTPVIDVKLTPHWSAAYCPFPNELCNCREQGVTKIGHWETAERYVPRPDFADIDIEPTPPDPALIRRLVKAQGEV